jgi:hypothetical protein
LRKEITVKKNKYVWITAVVSFIASGLASAALLDKKGCVDHPLFPTRMSGYNIANCDTKDFDTFDFETGKRDKVNVEGRLTKISYSIEDRSKEASGLAVVRNYENVIKSVRGTSMISFVKGKTEISPRPSRSDFLMAK